MFIFCPSQGRHLHLYHSGYFCLVWNFQSRIKSREGQTILWWVHKAWQRTAAGKGPTNQPRLPVTGMYHKYTPSSLKSVCSLSLVHWRLECWEFVQLWNNPRSWSCALHRVHEIVSGVYHRRSKDEVVGCRFQGWHLHWSLTFLGYSVDIPEIYTLH